MQRILNSGKLTGEWDYDRPDDYLWMVNWKSFGLPYCNVYVIAPDRHWPVKVGISITAEKRLATLQTSHWKRLFVTHCFWCPTIADAKRVERKAHAMLTEDNALLLGEWFDRNPDQAADVVRFAADVEGVDLGTTIEREDIRKYVSERVWQIYAETSSYRMATGPGAGSGPAYNWRTGRILK